MNLKQPVITQNLHLDLALTSSSFAKNNDLLNFNLLINSKNLSIVLVSWINFIRKDTSLLCPEIIRRHNLISLGLLFTDNLYISQLNHTWRKKNAPTDVLSFPSLEENIHFPPDQFVELGDIVISVEMALKQAKIHDHSLVYEILWLLSHGFLHLLGWEHSSPLHLDSMLSLQEQLLQEQTACSLINGSSIE